ncbi:hypothetical protein O6H91_22G036800 [Diphasiastrum complanatum]|uniref:Uncharacterized protein n=1 Tax=Diphasiastrum complanatum TaxID=34168 RepID=A0ACC2AEI9_DIPCM|nr:hypothetical protein O6H91_22G036800 [Diphasiastrum complanatum]
MLSQEGRWLPAALRCLAYWPCTTCQRPIDPRWTCSRPACGQKALLRPCTTYLRPSVSLPGFSRAGCDLLPLPSTCVWYTEIHLLSVMRPYGLLDLPAACHRSSIIVYSRNSAFCGL